MAGFGAAHDGVKTVPDGGTEVTRLVGMTLVVTIVMLAWGSPATGADMASQAKRELQTAIAHAKEGARADTIAKIELQLHYVVNCIEGKSGKSYFTDSGDVCERIKGNGLLADLKDSGMAGAHALPYAEIANQVALWGLAQGMAKNIAGAKAAAEMAKLVLEQAQVNFK